MKNGSMLLKERISLFHGKTNSIRFFSATELKAIIRTENSLNYQVTWSYALWYNGVIDGRKVLIKELGDWPGDDVELRIREIAVSTAMSTHNNVHKLVGCCLETEYPVLIFEWVDLKRCNLCNKMLLLRDDGSIENNQQGSGLEWKERLRIAWEISHAVAYLHTAFPRPIIHRDIKLWKVLLDQDNVAKLCDFGSTISIPEGKTYVEDIVIGTVGYLAPDYYISSMLTEKTDVYSFGVLLLVLLTGRNAIMRPGTEEETPQILVTWVKERKGVEDMGINQIIDPRIAKEDLRHQVQTSMELALRCTQEEAENRPTMVEVATQLKNIISSSELPHVPSTSNQRDKNTISSS